MKTLSGWNKDKIKLTDYLNDGDEIDFDLFTYLGWGFCSPNFTSPFYVQSGCLNAEVSGIKYFLTLKIIKGHFYYHGVQTDMNL